MIDYYLKFASEAEAQDILYTSNQPKYPNTDVIGIIYKPTGVMLDTAEGPVPEMVPIPGWHVNVRSSETLPELDLYHIEVKSPTRQWA